MVIAPKGLLIKPKVFVCLPKEILKHPPVAHRNRPAKGLLSVFEIAVAVGVVNCARRKFERMRRQGSLKAGREAGSDRDEIGAKIAAAKREDISFDFTDTMSVAYARYHTSFRAPDVIAVNVSKSALLKAAKLSSNSRNQAQLDAALKRLHRPVRIGPTRQFPPLLVGAEQREKKLRLSVAGKWLPWLIGRVPLPVPTQGGCANTLALFLFLAATDQRPGSNTNSIETEKLCRRIGIIFRWPAEASAALDAALEAVNNHLAEYCDQAALIAAKLPIGFELVPLKDGDRIRFKAIYATPARDDEDDYEQPDYTEDEKRAMDAYDREKRNQNEWAAYKQRLAKI